MNLKMYHDNNSSRFVSKSKPSFTHTDDAVSKECVKFANMLPGYMGKQLDSHFENNGWQLQKWDNGKDVGYQVYFGTGVQVDNLYEYGFPYLYDQEELLLFAESFYDKHIKAEKQLTPYKVRIEETYVREVVIWAEDEHSSRQIAEDLCSSDDIEFNYDNFTDRSTICFGKANGKELQIFEVFSEDGPVKKPIPVSLADKIKSAEEKPMSWSDVSNNKDNGIQHDR